MVRTLTMLVILLAYLFSSGQAQQQRALVIGINYYAPPLDYTPDSLDGRTNFENLNGAVSDAQSMRSLIRANFNFKKENITELYDTFATRAAILDEMNRLLNASKAGDIAFIYYAGHGSEVNNSLSFEKDKKDQTIVPSDTWKQGVRDIRDKELSKIFNDFVTKNIKLTVILDCCNSASMSRGPNISQAKARYAVGMNWDSKDATKLTAPELRTGNNFLLLSAAQSDEVAKETTDENNTPHGIFTSSFLKSLKQKTAGESVLNLFITTRAIIKSSGYEQEPIIAGSEERQKQTLFGQNKGIVSDATNVTTSIRDKDILQLEGGSAIGLRKGNILARINNNDTLYKLEIVEVTGVATAAAKVVTGNINEILPGTEFRVVSWTSSDAPLLKLYVPQTSNTDLIIQNAIEVAKKLKSSNQIKWIAKLGDSKIEPYTTIFWLNEKCYVKKGVSKAVQINQVSVPEILKYSAKDSTLYMEIPLSQTLSTEVINKIKTNQNISFVVDPSEANYVLFGRLGINNLPAFGFRKIEINLRDSIELLPLETDCFELSTSSAIVKKSVPDSLSDMAFRLCKIRAWILCESPSIGIDFPYELKFINCKTSKEFENSYRIGDEISLKMQNTKSNEAKIITPRFVYIFSMDKNGKMYLLYPQENNNQDNKYPKKRADDSFLNSVTILDCAAIPAPSGTDTYFLLASETPIQNPTNIFNIDAISSDALSRGDGNELVPLSDLLFLGNANTRGNNITPKKWTLKKYFMTCRY